MAGAVLFGAAVIRPGPIEIVVPVGLDTRSTIATVHRSRRLESIDRTTVEGIPVMTPGRVIVDVAGVVSAIVLEELVDDFLCRRLVSLTRLNRRARALGGRGRTGTRALRTILAAWTDGPIPASVAEMRVARCLIAHGLAQPQRQYSIYSENGLVGRVDLAYPEARVALELDSFRWHGGRRPFESDRARRNRLEALGWHVLQTTPASIAAGGHDLCAAVRALLDLPAA